MYGPVKSILQKWCQSGIWLSPTASTSIIQPDSSTYRMYSARHKNMCLIIRTLSMLWEHPRNINWDLVTHCGLSEHAPIMHELIIVFYFSRDELHLFRVPSEQRISSNYLINIQSVIPAKFTHRDNIWHEMDYTIQRLAQWMCHRGLPGDLVTLIAQWTCRAVLRHMSYFFVPDIMKRINEDIRCRILARPDHRQFGQTVAYICRGCPTRSKCQIISKNNRTAIYCYAHPVCYKILSAFLPPVETFLQRGQVMCSLGDTYMDNCLVHLARAQTKQGRYLLLGRCKECVHTHLAEIRLFIYLLFAVRHMGLPSDISALLARALVA